MPLSLTEAYDLIRGLDGRAETDNYEHGIALSDGDCYRVARGVHNLVRVHFNLNGQRTARRGLDSLASELGRSQDASYLVQICDLSLGDLNDEQDAKSSGTLPGWGHLFVILQAGLHKSVYQGFADSYALGEWVGGGFDDPKRAPDPRFTPARGCPMSDTDYEAWLAGVREVVESRDQQAAQRVFGGRPSTNVRLQMVRSLELWWCRRSDASEPAPAVPAAPPARTGLAAFLAKLFPCCFAPANPD